MGIYVENCHFPKDAVIEILNEIIELQLTENTYTVWIPPHGWDDVDITITANISELLPVSILKAEALRTCIVIQ
jgi:hypothetical protein